MNTSTTRVVAERARRARARLYNYNMPREERQSVVCIRGLERTWKPRSQSIVAAVSVPVPVPVERPHSCQLL